LSIDHKAYLFREAEFRDVLAGLLGRALRSGNSGPLREFIRRHRASLTDAMGRKLGADWENRLGDDPDVHRYADLALSRYYDRTASLGLGFGFGWLAAYLCTVPGVARQADVLICGKLFGPKGKRLDPGRWGRGCSRPPTPPAWRSGWPVPTGRPSRGPTSLYMRTSTTSQNRARTCGNP
jgi:hypothetical protein